MEQALAGKPIADPLTLYDCSLISDGAAAVLLAPLERASEFTERPVHIRGIAQTSDYVALEEKDDITTFRSVRLAAEKAYHAAGVGPSDIEFAELHDCFTIAEIMALEDLGFVEKGDGGPFTAAGCTALDGRLPVNASGGLKSKGHPVGATGTAQICDVVQQIRGEAGERQVKRHSFRTRSKPGRVRSHERRHYPECCCMNTENGSLKPVLYTPKRRSILLRKHSPKTLPINSRSSLSTPVIG